MTNEGFAKYSIMKFLKYLSLVLVFGALFLTSCEKDNIDEVIKTEETVITKTDNKILSKLVTSPTGLDLGCVTINYPFGLLTINEDELIVTSDAEFEAAISDSVNFVIDFIYPLTVVMDGEEFEVNNAEELGEYFASCIPDGGYTELEFPAFLINYDNSCYEIAYPIDLEDLDGNISTVNDEAEFADALAGANDVLFFVFPFELIKDDGTQAEAESAEGLFELLNECAYNDGPIDTICYGGTIACYDIVFPISFEMEDGSVESAANQDEFLEILLSDDVVNFSYPITLLDISTGTEIVINSDEELNAAFDECFEIPVDQFFVFDLLSGNDNCYTINFPVVVMQEDSTVVAVNDLETLNNYPNSTIVGTVDVTVVETGEVVTLETTSDLYSVLNSCSGVIDMGIPVAIIVEGAGICYNLSFPITVTQPNGDTVEVSDLDTLLNYYDDVVEGPFELVLIATGETVTINSFEEFFTILANC